MGILKKIEYLVNNELIFLKNVYSEVIPIDINQIYFHVSIYMTAALLNESLGLINKPINDE